MSENLKEEWSVEEFCDTLNEIAKIDKDNLIAVDGKPGTGKSTLCVKMCVKACPWFDMSKDILYGRKELIEWATTARPGSWGIADEAINALFKRDFQRGDQKFFIKVLDMCRDRNLTLFLCIPNFWSLDKHVLESRIRIRIHVAKTGFAFLWKPTSSPYELDPWMRKYNSKVCWNWDIYPNARRTKGFLGYLKFGDLGVRQKEEYLQIKAKKKAEIKAAEDAEESESEEFKKKSVEYGKLIVLDWLVTNGFLKVGWQKAYAAFEKVDYTTIIKRLKAYREADSVQISQVGSADKDMNSIISNTLYSNKGVTDIITQSTEDNTT